MLFFTSLTLVIFLGGLGGLGGCFCYFSGIIGLPSLLYIAVLFSFIALHDPSSSTSILSKSFGIRVCPVLLITPYLLSILDM